MKFCQLLDTMAAVTVDAVKALLFSTVVANTAFTSRREAEKREPS